MAFSLKLLSPATVSKGIASGAAYKAFLASSAESVADAADLAAPGREGDYIHAEGSKVVYANPRAAWHIVEFGSANNHPYSPLRRAVVAAGLRLDEEPKP